MWYFSWILGTLFACACGIINVMWLEAQQALDDANDAPPSFKTDLSDS
jgi:cyd operon protein YbgT